MLKNKGLFLILAMLLPLSFVNANIVGVGQVGERFVYKVNGVLMLVSTGDIIDGCIIKAGSGLQCSQQNNNLNNNNKLRDLSKNLEKLDAVLNENKSLRSQLSAKKNEISKIRRISNKKLSEKNKRLNKLSHYLNAIEH